MLSRISTSRGESGAKIGRRLLAVDGQLAELLEHPAGHGRLGEDLVVDEVLAAGHAADDRHQVVRGDVLEDERRRAGLDGVEQGVLVLVDGQDDDSRRLGSSRLIRWVVSIPPGAGRERSMRMMSGDS